jgi:hypothetical protein
MQFQNKTKTKTKKGVENYVIITSSLLNFIYSIYIYLLHIIHNNFFQLTLLSFSLTVKNDYIVVVTYYVSYCIVL